MPVPNNRLIITSLIKAVRTLDEALTEFNRDRTNSFVRDACIQRFEYCYDLATKMVRRHLKNIADNPAEIDAMPFQDVIRMAFEKGLLQHSWDYWWQYRDHRNATSHDYNENRALEVIDSLRGFHLELSHLINTLQSIYVD